ncbi:MAG: nuclease-related domain-containing protein [Rhodocyclaceae bacterium]
MIVKSKQFSTSTDPRIRAGEEAEKDMAYRLARRFGGETDVHVINDLRIEHEGNAFQIDHLLVTPVGLFIVESKSVHCPVTIKVWDEKREHWSRNFDGKIEGFDSPVLQAEEQGRLLKTFMRANAELMLGKLIGLVQKGFFYCPIIPLVAISRTGVIDVESGTLHKSVLKADEIAPEIARQLTTLRKKAKLLNLSLETGWEMTADEAARVAAFLNSAHAPKHSPKPDALPVAKELAAPASTAQGCVPRVGAPCPKCATRKLVRKSVKRADGTETDFLACAGHPKDCQQIFALVTKALDTPQAEAGTVESTAAIAKKPQRRQAGKTYCYKCKTDIPQNVADYCFGKREQFGGRAYCRSCQREVSNA